MLMYKLWTLKEERQYKNKNYDLSIVRAYKMWLSFRNLKRMKVNIVTVSFMLFTLKFTIYIYKELR